MKDPVITLIAFAWMPALWLYKTGRYPHFGGLWLPALLIALALFALVVRFRKPQTRPTHLPLFLAVSLLDAGLWAPVLNGALAPGQPVALNARIEVKPRQGRKGQDHRFLLLQHEGQELRTEIDPMGYWATRAVREGGDCRVVLRRGALGALWPETIQDR